MLYISYILLYLLLNAKESRDQNSLKKNPLNYYAKLVLDYNLRLNTARK